LEPKQEKSEEKRELWPKTVCGHGMIVPQEANMDRKYDDRPPGPDDELLFELLELDITDGEADWDWVEAPVWANSGWGSLT
jgi:hypothetical protein